jgi:hypothetical protein
MNTKLLDIIPTLPSHAHLVVEGGHLTLRRELVNDCVIGVGIYYLELPSSSPVLPFETLRVGKMGEPNQCWAVLTLCDGDKLELPAIKAGKPIWSVKPADERYFEVLAQAIYLFETLKPRVAKSTFSLLIGDLALPPELRHPFDWALSTKFWQLLSNTERSELVMLAESSCQNRGGQRVLRHAARVHPGDDSSERIYREQGYSILATAGEDGGLWLTADYLLDSRSMGHPVIALTKYCKSKPSCAVTLAGKLFMLAAIGTTHHIAVYDDEDDALIRQKSMEGAMVASYFEPKLTLVSTIVVRGKGNGYTVDTIDPATLRQPGRLSGCSELIKRATARIQQLGMARIDSRTSGVCCELANIR